MHTTVVPAEITSMAGLAWAWTLSFAPRLLAALFILVAGIFVSVRLSRGLDHGLSRLHRVDPTVRPFLTSIAQYGMLIVVVLLVLGQLGIQTTSLLAILGAAGLAIGLSLQGTLSNIAAGIMLLWLRPFETGDYIEVNAIIGTVESTGLFACRLQAFDGARLFAPHSTLWNVALRNHSRTGARMVALSVTLAADAEPEASQQALHDAVKGYPSCKAAPEPVVYLDSFSASAIVLGCRLWVDHASYSTAQRQIVAYLRTALLAKGIAATAMQQVARTVPSPADSVRLLDV